MSSEELKNKGNTAFSAGNYDEAIQAFTAAINVDPNNHVLYSNRSGAYAAQNDFESAKEDAEQCIAKNASWFKGYSRLGAAFHGLKQFDEAIAQHEKALSLAPENNKAGVQSNIDDVKRDQHQSKQQQQHQQPNPFAKFFGPDALQKIAANPKLVPLLAKPGYVQKIQMIQQNPNLIQGMMQDPDIMTTFIELMGLQSKFNTSEDSAPEGETESERKAREAEERRQDEHRREAAVRRQREEEDSRKKKEEDAKKKAEAAAKSTSPAEIAKAEGNKLYLARQFDEALLKYDEAFQLDPKATVYLLNRTAVIFEQGKYEECITECDAALEHGREQKADWVLNAKIMTRKASCLQKLKRFEEALKLYNSALLENRNADTLNKMHACEAEKKKFDIDAYFNPELSHKAKEDGNVAFKAENFPEAVKHYTEAIKRNPQDHIPYSNRAGALIKLMAFEDAVKDCDKCLELCPTFVRAFTRKAQAYMLTKQYHKALKMYDDGLKLDAENADLKDGRMRCLTRIQEVAGSSGDEDVAARAMQDPEIQGILHDSYMQMVLGEVQRDPSRLSEYMKDSRIAANINKLIAAGVIRTAPAGSNPRAGGSQRR